MFAEKLKELRKSRQLSQQQLADALGCSRSAIGMYESGQREPDFETSELIADFFGVRLDMLIGQKQIDDYFEAMRKSELKKAIFGKIVPDEMLNEVLEYAKFVANRGW